MGDGEMESDARSADQSAASADQSALRGTVAEVAMMTKSFLENRLLRCEGRWHGNCCKDDGEVARSFHEIEPPPGIEPYGGAW